MTNSLADYERAEFRILAASLRRDTAGPHAVTYERALRAAFRSLRTAYELELRKLDCACEFRPATFAPKNAPGLVQYNAKTVIELEKVWERAGRLARPFLLDTSLSILKAIRALERGALP